MVVQGRPVAGEEAEADDVRIQLAVLTISADNVDSLSDVVHAICVFQHIDAASLALGWVKVSYRHSARHHDEGRVPEFDKNGVSGSCRGSRDRLVIHRAGLWSIEPEVRAGYGIHEDAVMTG
jgi:hypothetical protein